MLDTSSDQTFDQPLDVETLVDTVGISDGSQPTAPEAGDDAPHADQDITNDNDENDGEETETDTEDNTEVEVEATEPELTPEELEKEKRAQGKMSQLERKANEESQARGLAEEAMQVFERVSADQSVDNLVETYKPLLASRQRYEQLQPYLARMIPALRGLDHNAFVQQFESGLQSEPQNYQQIRKIDQAKQEQARQYDTIRIETKLKLAYSIPEFGQLLSNDNQAAEQEFEEALEYAALQAKRFNRLGQTYSPEELVKQALYALNPNYTSPAKANLTKAKAATQSTLKNTIKGSSTTQPSNSDTSDVLKNLQPAKKDAYQVLYNMYVSDGLSKESAHKASLDWVIEN